MIESLRESDETIAALGELLIEATANGYSLGFLAPLSREKAAVFWRECFAEVAKEKRFILGAREDGRLVGTVTLSLARPENQSHRADVQKLLVARASRRRGLGDRLMSEVESLAARMGRSLLVLDTATDEAARLYDRRGWKRCGVIPDYAQWPDGRLCDAVFYWKRVSRRAMRPHKTRRRTDGSGTSLKL